MRWMHRSEAPQQPPLQPQVFGAGGPSPPASNQPPLYVQQAQPTPTIPPELVAAVLNLLQGRRREDPAEEAFRRSYTRFLEAISELPASFIVGLQGGVKDAVKGYVKELVKEEMRGIRDELLKLARSVEKAGVEASGGRAAEVRGEEVRGK